MITLWGEGRGFRVAWLMEEMGLPYRLRAVDMLKGVENDPEFLAINPAGYIPALEDDGVVLVESIAIMEYLLARHGPSPLAPAPDDAAFPLYQQFLHLGEAGIAQTWYLIMVTRWMAPEGERDNWTTRFAAEALERRMAMVRRQLARAPHMAGEAFTAADISVTYALEFASRTGYALGVAERDYVGRMSARAGYAQAMDVCAATKEWAASVKAG